MKIKAISLYQPYATLIAHKFKKFETRSWRPPEDLIGDIIAIHSTKKYGRDMINMTAKFCVKYPEVKSCLYDPDNGISHPPLGAILCICELKGYYPSHEYINNVSDREIDFGDWSPNRFVWELDVLHVFKKPILINGKQRLWNWDYAP